jgi:hypothetical protein
MIVAEEILEQMIRKYSECQSYSDFGTIVDHKPNHPVEFKTFFCKPNKFRFEWQDPYIGCTGAIWSDGLFAFHTFGDIGSDNAPRQLESLEAELARTRGIIRGPINTIPPLLLGVSRNQKSLLELQGLRRLGEEEVGGELCHHIVGSFRMPEDIELWISKTDCSLKKLFWRLVVPAAEKAAQDKLLMNVSAQSAKGFLRTVGPVGLLFLAFSWRRYLSMLFPSKADRLNEFSWTYSGRTFNSEERY